MLIFIQFKITQKFCNLLIYLKNKFQFGRHYFYFNIIGILFCTLVLIYLIYLNKKNHLKDIQVNTVSHSRDVTNF